VEFHRFETLVRAIKPATRRSLLGGALAGLLALTPAALEPENATAGNRNRRRRRPRKQTWKLSASSMSYLDEHPSSGGDSLAYNSKALITITQRRRRFQICATFQYYTGAATTNQINVKDVIIQPGNTSHTTQPVYSFFGWTAANVHEVACQSIDRGVAQDILADPGTYHVNIRTNHPHHPFGAVAAPLTRH
jgi:hypothetical protein